MGLLYGKRQPAPFLFLCRVFHFSSFWCKTSLCPAEFTSNYGDRWWETCQIWEQQSESSHPDSKAEDTKWKCLLTGDRCFQGALLLWRTSEWASSPSSLIVAPAPVINQRVASGISSDRDLDHVYDWIGSLKSFPKEPLEETLMIIHWVKGCYWSINGNRYVSPDRKMNRKWLCCSLLSSHQVANIAQEKISNH